MTDPTAQELRLLGLLATGYTVEQGARVLNISPRTFRRRLSATCTRLGVTRPIQAVAWAARHNFI